MTVDHYDETADAAERRAARAVREHRRGDRRPARGPHGHRLRRRGPRERGRPHHGGPVRHRREHQLHGQGRPRPHLPRAHAAALRRARPAADDEPQRGAPADRVHRLRRGARRRDHGHLGGRPGAHHPGRHRPRVRAGGPRAARPRVPAHGPARRRARALRADRGGRRPGQARPPEPVRRHLRDHERRRHHGARARPRPVRAQARAQDHHRRRPHQVPAPQRAPGAPRRHGRDADQVRRLQGHRLRVGARRQPPRGHRQGRRGRQEGRARARPLGVPDRRHLRVAALRLRRPARPRRCGASRPRASAWCCTCARRAAASASSTS